MSVVFLLLAAGTATVAFRWEKGRGRLFFLACSVGNAVALLRLNHVEISAWWAGVKYCIDYGCH